jgi:hypothetical protein
MKTQRIACALAALFLTAGVARPGVALPGEELAVVQAMAVIINRDAPRAFDFLYFESDFSAEPYVASSLANPDRTQFCGLSRERAQTLVAELSSLTAQRVAFDKSVAKSAGMSIGEKKLARFRYLTLSRVLFAPDMQRAWVAADLNGESGAVFRLDKVAGAWSKTARCGGWVKAE